MEDQAQVQTQEGQTERKDPSDMTNEELAQAFSEVRQPEPQEQQLDVQIPDEYSDGVGAPEPAAEGEHGAKQVQEQPQETNKPEYISKRNLSFNTGDDLADGYVNLANLLDKQGNELGELRRMKAEWEKTQNTIATQTPQISQTQPGTFAAQATNYDPYDPSSVAQEIDRRVEAKFHQHMKGISDQLSALQQNSEKAARDSQEQKVREEITRLSEKYDDFKIEGDIDRLIAVRDEAIRQGADPGKLSPDSAKLEHIIDLVRMVNNSNGMVSNIEEAHMLKLLKGDGLKKMLLDAKSEATINTVNKINDKRVNGTTLAKIGGQPAARKTLKQLTNEELEEQLHRVAAAEEEQWEMERINRM